MTALPAIAWTPAAAPTIALWGAPDTSPGARTAAPVPLRWPDLVAGETADVALDASALLAPGDVLTATASCATLPVLAAVVAGALVGVLLSGGTAGEDNVIDLRLSTSSGRAVHRVARVLTT